MDGLKVLKTAVKNVGLPYLKSENHKQSSDFSQEKLSQQKQYIFV